MWKFLWSMCLGDTTAKRAAASPIHLPSAAHLRIAVLLAYPDTSSGADAASGMRLGTSVLNGSRISGRISRSFP